MCLDEVQISAGQEASSCSNSCRIHRAQGLDTLVLPTPQVRPVQPLIHNAWFSSAWKLPFCGDGGKQLWSQIPSGMLLFHIHGFLGAVGYIWLDSTPLGWHCFWGTRSWQRGKGVLYKQLTSQCGHVELKSTSPIPLVHSTDLVIIQSIYWSPAPCLNA